MRIRLALLLATTLAACGGGSSIPDDAGVALPWPASPPSMSGVAPLRGSVWTRGIIHAHSSFSHDACDGQLFDDDGNPNLDTQAVCLAQVRAAMCQNREDWYMMTDHKAYMAYYDWTTVLLYDEAAGDVLVEKNGAPIANRVACAGGGSVLLMQGHEDDYMPVGLEKHFDGTPAERDAFYGRRDAEASDIYRNELGALVLQNHTEQFTVEDLAAVKLDGIEVFNTHAALLPGSRQNDLHVSGSGAIEGLLPFFDFHEDAWPTAPEPDLALLGFLEDFAVYNALWDGLLARGRMLGVLGTDVHQNVYTFTLKDGDRGDSFRRMGRMYSNWVLVPAGELTPDALKDAMRAGRLAGVFESLGMPAGLDFHAEAGGTVYEIGDEVELAAAPTIVALAPTVLGLDPQQAEPAVALSLKCNGAEVATGEGRIDYTPTATGYCRLDVTIVPRHLEPFLGTVAQLAQKTYPWVKLNPIYVR
jgi:hypothetical protein